MLKIEEIIPTNFKLVNIESSSRERKSIFTTATYGMRHPGIYSKYTLSWDNLEFEEAKFLSSYFNSKKIYDYFDFDFNFLQNSSHLTIQNYTKNQLTVEDTNQDTASMYFVISYDGRKILKQAVSTQEATTKTFVPTPEFEIDNVSMTSPTLDLTAAVKRTGSVTSILEHSVSSFSILLEGSVNG